MNPAAFCTRSRVLIVAGKGGVGKTTAVGVISLLAAQLGLRVLSVQVEPSSDLSTMLGSKQSLDYEETSLLTTNSGGEIRARAITPDKALVEYLDDHGMRKISKRLTTTGALEVISTAIPGIGDLLVLGKIKQIERAMATSTPGSPDLIVLDAPASGHAITFLSSARSLADATSTGPIRSQASDVADMLSDPERCQVLLVTIPEETPVNEAAETAFKLEDVSGVMLGPVIVNSLWPVIELPEETEALIEQSNIQLDEASRLDLLTAASMRRQRQGHQSTQLKRLSELLPLPQLHLPYRFKTELNIDDTNVLASALAKSIEGLGQTRPPEKSPVQHA